MSKTVKFLGEQCTLKFNTYHNGQNNLQLISEDGYSPMATASVCVEGLTQAKDTIFIKSWSENQGMLEALVEAGIVENTDRVIPSGFVYINVCKLLVDPR